MVLYQNAQLQETKNLEIKVFEQSSNGKANAVFEGFKNVVEIIAILDSDLSVDPETLVDFLIL